MKQNNAFNVIDQKYPESEWILNKFQQGNGKVSYHFEFRKKGGYQYATEKFKGFSDKSFEGILEKITKI